MRTVKMETSNKYTKSYFNKVILLLLLKDSYMYKEDIYNYIEEELGYINKKIIDNVIDYLINNNYLKKIGIRYKIINENINN